MQLDLATLRAGVADEIEPATLPGEGRDLSGGVEPAAAVGPKRLGEQAANLADAAKGGKGQGRPGSGTR